MRRLYALLLATTFLTTVSTPAKAEPISGFIGLTALLAGAFGTTAAVGGVASVIGGLIVTGALTVGATLISSALAPDATPTEASQTRQQEPSRGTTLNVQYGGAQPRQASMGL